MSENKCVCCDEIIPEGRQVCISCERKQKVQTSSDYISKSALLKHLWDWRFQECPVGVCDEETETYKTICECIEAVKEQPTLSETEIIRKPFERVVKQLSEQMPIQFNGFGKTLITVEDVIKILKEECGINE